MMKAFQLASILMVSVIAAIPGTTAYATTQKTISGVQFSGPSIIPKSQSKSYLIHSIATGAPEYTWKLCQTTKVDGTTCSKTLAGGHTYNAVDTTAQLTCSAAGLLGGNTASVTTTAPTYVMAQITSAGSCGGGTFISKTVTITCDNSIPYTKGDPHFKTWTGQKYDFHGECDLVLVHNPDFHSGLGMDVHVRTKLEDERWSYIERVAVRIGDEVIEIKGGDAEETVNWLNGQPDLQNTDVPVLSGFPISFSTQQRPKSLQRLYNIDLGGGENIEIKTFRKFVDVSINSGSAVNFAGSLGLLGDFEQGHMVGRDGQTLIEDPNAFGQEWQVLLSEHQLFQSPITELYQQCRMPSAKATERRLRAGEIAVTEDDAEKACAHVPEHERDLCVFDVLATNDADTAGAY